LVTPHKQRAPLLAGLSLFMKYIFIILLFFISILANCQEENISGLQSNHQKINTMGMSGLGVWSVSNMVYGGLQLKNSTTEEKYFHQMNILWNTVNFSLAGLGLFNALKKELPTNSIEMAERQRKTEKIFLWNAGIDLIYITSGIIMNKHKNSDAQISGFGKSLILQGSFLLLFDGLMYKAHKSNRKFQLSPNFSTSANSIIIGGTINF